jgi:hypothetical protein
MRLRRIVTAIVLVAYLPACAHYQPTAQPLSELTAPPDPVQQVRVTLTSGIRIQVTSPRVDSDTLRGTEGYSRTSGPPVAIPLAAITKVEMVQPAKKLSTGAAIAIVMVTAGLVALLVVGAQELDEGLDELDNLGN